MPYPPRLRKILRLLRRLRRWFRARWRELCEEPTFLVDQGARGEQPCDEDGNFLPARCQGYACPATVDIQLDPVSQRYLCQSCWAKVTPKDYGVMR